MRAPRAATRTTTTRRWRVIALVAVASLFATPVIPSAPAEANVVDRLAAALPALPSPPAPNADPVVPDRLLDDLAGDVAPHPSELDALYRAARPSAFDPARSVPVEAETTPTERVFENRSDGTRTSVINLRPVRYRDEAGAWRDFDVTPLAGPDGTIRAEAAPGAARLAPRAGGAVATVDTPAGAVTLTHPDATDAPAATRPDKVVYDGALAGGRDLELALTPDGFKETLVLPDAASPPTYVDRFGLPAGMGARQGADGVEFTDASGAVVASFGGGFAFDAAFPAGGADTTAPVSVRLVGGPTPADPVASVEVGVDPAWLATPGRAFPVRVDPIFQQNTAAGAGGRDTYVQSGAWQNTAFGSSTAIVSGTDPNGYVSRSLLYFNLGSLPSSTRIVTSATLGVYNWYSPSCSARQTNVYGLGGGFSDATTWNTQPPLDGAGVMGSLSFARGASGCVADWAHFDITPLAQRWVTSGAPNYGLALRAANEADAAAIRYYWSFEANGYITSPAISITYNNLPNIATPAAPVQTDPNEPAVVYTATPRLEVNPATDPDGEMVEYFFRITESPDAELGSKTEGLPSTNPYFEVPAGPLRDGVTYYWHAWTKDPTHWRQPDWVRSFRVDLRLGAGVEATDAYGPAAVNLATGNLNVRVDSPAFATLAGPLGVSYTYNSLAEDNTGLTGRYFNDPAVTRDFAGKTEALVRRDTDLNFEWGVEQSPGPGVAATNYLVRWDGFFTPPAWGTYYFSAGHDDGVRIWVGGTKVVDRWTQTNYTGEPFGTGVLFNEGERKPIRIEYNQQGGRAIMTLVAKGPFGPGGAGAQTIVPASWLSAEAGPLPKGWSLSAGVGGDGAYAGARGFGGSATVVDASGRAHNFASTNPGFRPPAGQEAVLGRAGDGTLALRAGDGSAYAFDVAGQMTGVATEGGSPAAPTYFWSGGRLRTVTDPARGLPITFSYGGDTTCPATLPPGFSAAPTGMLCRVAYWDNTTTDVFYVGGNLARVVDPGGVTTDFAYDSAGRLTAVRDPLASDAVAAGVAADDVAARTVIAYNGAGRVATITAPAPTPGAARPQRTFTLVSSSPTASEVTVADAGVTGARRVVMDKAGRATSVVDATNKATAYVWDDKVDRVLSVTDPAGRRTTYHYDDPARPAGVFGPLNEVFGPAPTSCFGADRRPNNAAGCATMGYQKHYYDESIQGLAAAYWPNPTFAGKPTFFGTGVGEPSGALVANWGTGSPGGGLAPGAWSGRFSGELTLAAASNLQVAGDGYRALWVDSVPVGPSAAIAAGRHRILVEVAGTTTIALQSRPAGSGSFANLSGSALLPRYDLPTRTVTEDGPANQAPTRVVATAYANPHTGAPTAVVDDPVSTVVPPIRLAGQALALTTSTTYEAPGTGFGRRLSRTLPAGNATTYAYHPTTTAVANPCPGGGSAVQGGLLRTATGPDPDGPHGSRVDEYVYDAAGRPVATRVGSGAWTCTTYDPRGRVLSRTIPASATSPARTVSYNWKVGNNPLVTSVTDPAGTITTTVDLLGRIVSYTDARGHTTTSTYDQAGRLTGTATPANGWSSGMAYDAAGRPTTQRLDGAVVATAAYDPASGQLSSVDYPLGVLSGGNGTSLGAIGRDQAGRVTELSWRRGSAVLATDTVVRSPAGRVLTNLIDGVATHTYDYDHAGRLEGATSPGHTWTYGFASTGGCGSLAGAGRNTNRTTLVHNGGSAIEYCYDAADRLVSTTDVSVGALAYDARGNTTTLGPQAIAYDGADRHSTTTTGTTTVSYDRDATDRIVARKVNGAVVAIYGYAGPGDSPAFINASTGVLGTSVVSRYVGVLGGVSINKGSINGDRWSYPNIHGDVLFTADALGLQGAPFTYDPFGNPLDGVPENGAGNFDYGWLGAHQRPLEHQAGIATIEMGARQYVPNLGRFLQVDPIEGGGCTDYGYACDDPINRYDLQGLEASDLHWETVATGPVQYGTWRSYRVPLRAGKFTLGTITYRYRFAYYRVTQRARIVTPTTVAYFERQLSVREEHFEIAYDYMNAQTPNSYSGPIHYGDGGNRRIRQVGVVHRWDAPGCAGTCYLPSLDKVQRPQ